MVETEEDVQERDMMPPIRYFTVTQVREVRVDAPSALDAAKGASDLFSGVKPAEEGPVTQRAPIIERKLSVEENR